MPGSCRERRYSAAVPRSACSYLHVRVLRWIKPFGTRRDQRARVRVERLTSRATSFRPLRAPAPVHGRDWHGLACGKCDAFQYTSPARSEPRRVRCVQRGPVQRWRWRAAGEVASNRGRPAAKGGVAPLTQEDLTLTVQHASARFMFTLLRRLPCRARLLRRLPCRARWEFSAACHSRLAGSCVCVRACVRACV
jgi:hypothetical protein